MDGNWVSKLFDVSNRALYKPQSLADIILYVQDNGGLEKKVEVRGLEVSVMDLLRGQYNIMLGCIARMNDRGFFSEVSSYRKTHRVLDQRVEESDSVYLDDAWRYVELEKSLVEREAVEIRRFNDALFSFRDIANAALEYAKDEGVVSESFLRVMRALPGYALRAERIDDLLSRNLPGAREGYVTDDLTFIPDIGYNGIGDEPSLVDQGSRKQKFPDAEFSILHSLGLLDKAKGWLEG